MQACASISRPVKHKGVQLAASWTQHISQQYQCVTLFQAVLVIARSPIRSLVAPALRHRAT
jgi:hypothetical protein